VEAFVGVVIDAGKVVGKPCFGIDGVELCGFDERVDGSIMLWLEPEFWSLKPKPRKIASLEQFHGISGR
jgi:hypothetical protein